MHTQEAAGPTQALHCTDNKTRPSITLTVYVVTNCTFEGNRALNGVGGGMMWWASHEPDQAKATNRFNM